LPVITPIPLRTFAEGRAKHLHDKNDRSLALFSRKRFWTQRVQNLQTKKNATLNKGQLKVSDGKRKNKKYNNNTTTI
jgi:hypothetical protein